MQTQGRFLPAILLVLWLSGCGGEEADVVDAAEQDAGGLLPAPAAPATDCGEAGVLQAELFGALAGRIDWSAAELRCEGMPRPAGAGARLRFAGSIGEDARELAFIVAIPDLRRGETGSELAVNVTLIEEGRGRFFSTTDLDTCWTDVSAQDPLGADTSYSIVGELYCIAPLAEVNGDSSVSIETLRYSGLVDWSSN